MVERSPSTPVPPGDSADHLALELRCLRDRERFWGDFQRFVLRLHGEPGKVAAAAANDGRSLLGCDRLSVWRREGKRWQAAAISGAAGVDRRANQVSVLARLVAAAANAGEPFWCELPAQEPPASLQQALAAYRREVPAAAVAILPLCRPDGNQAEREPFAALVLEGLTPAATLPPRDRTQLVAAQIEAALGWDRPRSSGLCFWRARAARQIVSPLRLALLGGAAIALALAFIPADFTVPCSGQLQPAHRREIFAPDDAVVREVRVQHGERVQAGQLLLALADPKLEMELRRVRGEIQTVQKQLAGKEARRLVGRASHPDRAAPDDLLALEHEELLERLDSLTRQQKILDDSHRQLDVLAPFDGQLLTWDVGALLAARPVRRGEKLMTLGDTAGPWVVELAVPDSGIGHVLDQQADGPCEVSFVLPADDAAVHRGRIREIGAAAENPPAPPSVRVVVEPDDAIARPRPGAVVAARVHCGRRALGYVWLHDLWDALRRRFW